MSHYTINDDKIRTKIILVIWMISFIAALILYKKIGGLWESMNSWLSKSDTGRTIVLFDIIPNLISVPVIYAILFFLHDKLLWKNRLIMKLHGIPDLNGEWKGELVSSFCENKKFDMTIIVKQTWTQMSMIAKYDMSRSSSKNITIKSDGAVTKIYFGFTNESKDVNNLDMYFGYNEITLEEEEVDDKKIQIMEGKYCNNRKSPRQKGGNVGVFRLKKVS